MLPANFFDFSQRNCMAFGKQPFGPVGAARLLMSGFDHCATMRSACSPLAGRLAGIITVCGNTQQPTGKPERITESQIPDSGVSLRDSLAQYAAAFVNISHSMRSLAFSFRNRLFSSRQHRRPRFVSQNPGPLAPISPNW